MKAISLILLLLIPGIHLLAQEINGKIKDEEGNPIPYATLFVRELAMGTTSNSEGSYSLKLPRGTYNIQFRSMGFSPREIVFVIDTVVQTKDVVLSIQTINLQEIRVYASNEDPAYPIIRRAVAMAPYYRNQIVHFDANLYIKTTSLLDKVPKLLKKQIEVQENGSKLKVGEINVGESFSELTFDAPDKYNQKVITSNMSDAQKKSETMEVGLIPLSLYAANFESIIMPLSPHSFAHYDFKLIGTFNEGHYLVNKIKVTPKVKGKLFIEGHLNIIDGLWSAHSAQLKNTQFFGDVKVDIQYANIRDDIWMPINQNLLIEGGFMGIKGKASYTSSLKYTQIMENATLKRPVLLEEYDKDKKIKKEIEAKEQLELTARQKKIEAILKKETLKNREAITLARLMELEAKTSQPAKEKTTNLEIEPKYNLSPKEGAANSKRDSLFWDSIRPNPLTNAEVISFKKCDSVQLAKTNTVVDTTIKKKRDSKFDKFIFGGTIAGNDSSLALSYGGLINLNAASFNAVDGFTYFQKATITKKFENKNFFSFTPQIGYAFSSKKVLWEVNSAFNYLPLKMGVATLSFGRNTSDYLNQFSGITPFLNAETSLLFKENYARYYGQTFFKAANTIEVRNGLFLTTSIGYYDRTHLANTTNFSFLQHPKKYHENTIELPDQTTLTPTNQKDFIVGIYAEFIPEMHYRIKNGVKYRAYSNWPTFSVTYKKAIPTIANSVGSWSYFEGKIQQRFKIGAFSNINYVINGGIFLNNKNVHFADYAQIATTYVPFEVKNNNMQLQLLPYYMYNTNKSFVKGAVTYSSPYIAIKYLPWVSSLSWKENLHFSYLSTPNLRNYTEMGYSISNIVNGGTVGIFAGHENAKFKSWSMKFSYAF